MDWLILSTIIIIPFLVVAFEALTSIRNRSQVYLFSNKNHSDYQMLIPIWGNIKYLENVEYLSKYGSKVMLCTTGDESTKFYDDLEVLARKHNFQIFKDESKRKIEKKQSSFSNQRTTSGAMRDTIIRNALRTIKTVFVVTLDADSTTSTDMSYLVGELEHRKLDIASIKVVPNNSDASILARLQTFEYDIAMKYRFLCPWLISGACHVAKTDVLRKIMNKHSLFFQGNDVETGILAKALGYKVGYIPFVVLTAVPASIKAWFRQRLAWGGGEFRLFIVNFKFILKHPFFWFYGAIITICVFPLRWAAFFNVGVHLYIILGLYVGLIFHLHWKKRNPWLLLVPIYTIFITLVMTPLGILWYFYMAHKDKNYGFIIPQKKNKSFLE